MKVPFTIDGVAYRVHVPSGGLKRSFEVLDGENAGRLISGDLNRDVIGTFYNYELSIEPDTQNVEEYDRLFEVLSAPQDFHTVTFPYGQSTLTFLAYVTSGQDTLTDMIENNDWTGLTVHFIAKAPQRT